MGVLWLVIPCYNEEEMLPLALPVLKKKLCALIEQGKIAPESKIALVNDGSQDCTWQLIQKYHEEDGSVVGINLAHNKGHQNALMAGLMVAKEYADVTVSMDADLQDDIDAVDKMIDEYAGGADIVFGVRSSRKTDTFLKRATAEGFYKVMQKMGVKTVFNHADFRLMSKRALEALSSYGEDDLFLRGIVTDIGYNTAVVTYARRAREAGKSKYHARKMIALALNGITSFSTKPLNISAMFAVISAFLAFAGILTGVLGIFFWPELYTFCFLLGAVFTVGFMLFLSLWVMGLYVGKTYLQVKHRPRYIVSTVLYKEN